MEATTAPTEWVDHSDVYGGHGQIFRAADGRIMLEHCHQGHWGCCPLNVTGDDLAARHVRVAAMKHLQRKAHRGVEPQQLAGLAHAGGGELVHGVYVKGPAR